MQATNSRAAIKNIDFLKPDETRPKTIQFVNMYAGRRSFVIYCSGDENLRDVVETLRGKQGFPSEDELKVILVGQSVDAETCTTGQLKQRVMSAREDPQLFVFRGVLAISADSPNSSSSSSSSSSSALNRVKDREKSARIEEVQDDPVSTAPVSGINYLVKDESRPKNIKFYDGKNKKIVGFYYSGEEKLKDLAEQIRADMGLGKGTVYAILNAKKVNFDETTMSELMEMIRKTNPARVLIMAD